MRWLIVARCVWQLRPSSFALSVIPGQKYFQHVIRPQTSRIELRKVVWPNRQEETWQVAISLVFAVLIIMAICFSGGWINMLSMFDQVAHRDAESDRGVHAGMYVLAYSDDFEHRVVRCAEGWIKDCSGLEEKFPARL